MSGMSLPKKGRYIWIDTLVLDVVYLAVVLALYGARKRFRVLKPAAELNQPTGQPSAMVIMAGTLPSRSLHVPIHLLLLPAKTDGCSLLSQPEGRRRESWRGGRGLKWK